MYNDNKDRHPDGWKDSVNWFWNNPSTVESFIKENKDILAQYMDAIVKSGVKIAGFTIYESSYLMSCYIASELKQRNKNIIVVFGGPSTAAYLRGKEIIKFISEVHRLKIPTVYPHHRMVNRNEVIADYYFYTKEYEKAIPYYKDTPEKESWDTIKEEKLKTCYEKAGVKST